jgi:hypothetical protein
MNKCPFEFTNENCEVIVEGKNLVHIFDWKVTAPFQVTIPMVEVIEFEGEKVKHARMFLTLPNFRLKSKPKWLLNKPHNYCQRL